MTFCHDAYMHRDSLVHGNLNSVQSRDVRKSKYGKILRYFDCRYNVDISVLNIDIAVKLKIHILSQLEVK